MTQYYKFLWGNRENGIQKVLCDWHHELHQQKGHRNRAFLRRCTTPREILLQAPFYHLHSLLIPYLDKTGSKDDTNRLLAVAAIAGLLAHIKQDFPEYSFAAQLYGVDQKKSRPIMSELRFNQLQKSRNWDEFYRRLRRAVQLLKGQANIISLADSILHWGYDLNEDGCNPDSKPAERLLIRWAIDYFDYFKKSQGA